MALHPKLPKSPYAVLPPDYRWFPAAEELRSTAYEKLLPPLVAKVRSEVKAWRDASRGLRRMYFGTDTEETVSVMGTLAFMEFVESIQSEGVELEYRPMGGGAQREESLIVEVDAQNGKKDIEALDIAIPRLSRRFNREFKELDSLDPAKLGKAPGVALDLLVQPLGGHAVRSRRALAIAARLGSRGNQSLALST